MFIVTKLLGEGLELSSSMQFIIIALAESASLALRKNPLPDFYSCGVKYQPEDPSNLADEWTDPYTTFERRYGDCDDMVIWRLAEIYKKSGYNPIRGRANIPAWPVIAWDSGNNYHVYIRHINGMVEDPAKIMKEKLG